jgi:hypothetical protein
MSSQIMLAPTSEKSIAGYQKQRGRLYTINYKPGRKFLTRTNTSKFYRLSIGLYRVYAYSRIGSNID